MSTARVFISYRREDSAAEARGIHTALVDVGGSDAVFMDARRIKPGDIWPEEIRAEHSNADILLVVVKKWTDRLARR